MQHAVQQHELAEQLAVEDGFQVEVDVGGRSEGRGVAQQTYAAAVGEDRPEVGLGAVEAVLDHGLRGDLAGGRALVQVLVPRGEVDQGRAVAVGDREVLVRVGVGRDARRAHLCQRTEVQLAEELGQPVRTGAAGRVGGRGAGHGVGGQGGAQVAPERLEVLPGALGLVAHGHRGGQAVVGGLGARQVPPLGDAQQHVGGEESADRGDGGEGQGGAGCGGHQASAPDAVEAGCGR